MPSYKFKLSRTQLQRLAFSLKLWSFGIMSFLSWGLNLCWFRRRLLVELGQNLCQNYIVLWICPSILDFMQWKKIDLTAESDLTSFCCHFLNDFFHFFKYKFTFRTFLQFQFLISIFDSETKHSGFVREKVCLIEMETQKLHEINSNYTTTTKTSNIKRRMIIFSS